MIRDRLKAALVTAMKGGDKDTTATIRLIQAAIKNRDIELRGKKAEAAGRVPAGYDANYQPISEVDASFSDPADDALVTEVLQKMIKQRRESVEMFRTGNREELAAKEEAEIAVIERFLPAQMSEDEARAAIAAIVAELGASSMKDMGRVMAEVKARHATSIEPAKASGLVKAALSA